MESIINRQTVSRRRQASVSRGSGEPGSFGESGLLAPGGALQRRSLLQTRRLPASTTPVDFAFLEGRTRPIEFRQRLSTRQKRRADATRVTSRDTAARDAAAHGAAVRAHRHSGLSSLRTWLGSLLRGLGRPLLRAGTALRSAAPRTLLILAAALLLLGAALFVGNRFLHPILPLPSGALLPEDGASDELLLAYVTPEMNGDLSDSSGQSLPPPPATLELKSYTVRKSDSIASVAKRFGLNIDTLISMNGITSPRSFTLGTELRIPNMNGLLYKVRAGDSLSSVARLYKIDSTRIADANDLGSAMIKIGQTLFIPGARLPETALRSILGERVMWPIRGVLSSYFGYRPDPFTGVRSFHAGIDIAADPGTPVKAAMDGRVADVGYNPTFGNYVILSHASGIQTLYGHLTSYSVRIGQTVGQGTVVGLVGSTGYSTGPHLHFGLYQHGNPVNPLKYLK